MKNVDIKKYIRNQVISQITGYILVILLFFLLAIYVLLNESVRKDVCGLLIILSFFSLYVLYKMYDVVFILFDIEKHKLFKKFGCVNNVERIVLEAMNNFLYEDERIWITKNYLIFRNDYTKIVNLQKVLAIYGYVHSINITTTGKGIVLIDEYGEEFLIYYPYIPFYTVKKLQRLFDILLPLCPKAHVGYSPKTLRYIEENITPLNLNCNEKS